MGLGVIWNLVVLILAVCLALSPLFIWKWTKENNRELRKQTAILADIARKLGADGR